MNKKNNYFTCFIFFCHFTLLDCGEKNFLSNLTNSQALEPVGAGCIWLLEAGARCFWLLEAGAGCFWLLEAGAGAGAA